MPGPRDVQAFHKLSQELLREACVHGIVETLNLADEICGAEGREIDLLMHTRHDDEDEMLIERGWWGEGSASPDLKR